MDFLKSAVASAIAKGSSLPYTFGDRLDNDKSIWSLHNGTKRVSRIKLSIQLLWLIPPCRKTARHAAYLPSMCPRTSHNSPWPEMPLENYVPSDILASSKFSTRL